jgi:hypothetical protein
MEGGCRALVSYHSNKHVTAATDLKYEWTISNDKSRLRSNMVKGERIFGAIDAIEPRE